MSKLFRRILVPAGNMPYFRETLTAGRFLLALGNAIASRNLGLATGLQR